jgi:hypothetical protein
MRTQMKGDLELPLMCGKTKGFYIVFNMESFCLMPYFKREIV